MKKKITSKRPKSPRSLKLVPPKGNVEPSNKVVSISTKLEHRTEKRMADFVKEIVSQKKKQSKIQEKPNKTTETIIKTQKKTNKKTKKKKPRFLKIVKNKPEK